MNKTIYNPILILLAWNTEKKWYKSLGLNDDEQAEEVMVFIIENNKIKSTKLIKRALVTKYEPCNNEYYLDRIRDTESIITDYNLEPVQKLVNTYNKPY